jgi:hypothetical protein
MLPAHHAIAEALHLELADVASPAFPFAFLGADQLLALLLQGRSRPGLSGSRRERHEGKHKREYLHLYLLGCLRSSERTLACYRLSWRAEVKTVT